MSADIEHDPRWQAILQRDASVNEQFVYAVKTTGIYCRPGSASRIPKPEHVEFFDSAEDAEQAGYRPSKRLGYTSLELQQRYTEIISKVCQFIETCEVEPSLTVLAEQAALSSYHFHRIFKMQTGVTPKTYIKAWRANRLRKQLEDQAKVTTAIYEAGFNSSNSFYEQATGILGMQPKDYQRGGIHQQITFAVGQSRLGSIMVAQSLQGICAITLGDDPAQLLQDLQDLFPKAELIGGDAAFEQLVAQVVGFVEAPEIGWHLPLDIQGTVFQQRVWQALQKIPLGKTVTYSELAEQLGQPKAVRAVASACANNKIAVAIPCHRVIRQDGSLAGYRWGIERKQQLLQHEHHIVEELAKQQKI